VVAAAGDNAVFVVDTSTLKEVARVPVGTSPSATPRPSYAFRKGSGAGGGLSLFWAGADFLAQGVARESLSAWISGVGVGASSRSPWTRPVAQVHVNSPESAPVG
jgi:YVTN family beta-propeller protein